MIPEREHFLHKRRKGRNLALGGALLLFVLLVFAVTIAKLASGHMIQGF